MQNMRIALFFSGLLTSCNVAAQYLSTHAAQIPSVGIMSMNSFDVTPQTTVGLGYSHLLTENLWGLVHTAIGYGKTEYDGAKETRLGTVQGHLGLKYNFLTENWRPYSALYIQYLHLLGESIANSGLQALPVSWVGLRPSAGLEYFFWNEMSLELEAGYVAYLHLDEELQHGAQAQIGYNLYF